MLATDETRFEVVVSDDASKDNAEELLTQIKDPRFRYFRNEKNLGAHENWEHSLELGRGEWLYLVMGRDKPHSENIDNLIEILKQARKNNITYIHDSGTRKKDIDIYDGIDKMINLLDYFHPTGDIFYRETFTSIPDRVKLFTMGDMYSENYVRREMLLRGKGAITSCGMFYGEIKGELLIDRSKVKSSHILENPKDLRDLFIAPKRKTLQFFELIDMIEIDLHEKFTQNELNKYFKAKFSHFLGAVSYSWFTVAKNSEVAGHYNFDATTISIREALQNIIRAYRDTKAHLMEKNIYTRSKQKIMYVCTAKCSVYYMSKMVTRKLLEPIGMWKILKYIQKTLKNLL